MISLRLGGGGGDGNCQSFQNVIVIILYHVQFLHGMPTFNGSNVTVGVVNQDPCQQKVILAHPNL
jgi:hypothetical protein